MRGMHRAQAQQRRSPRRVVPHRGVQLNQDICAALPDCGHAILKLVAVLTATVLRRQIVGLGVDAYLKMLLIDNFVHTDLHPGNIFVRPQVRRTNDAHASVT